MARPSPSLLSLMKKGSFKAKHGTDLTGTNRNIAFCAHAINTPDKIMIVPDTRLDKRFFDSPVVIGEPHIVFYAGMPLVTEGGHALGTLCVMDNKPGKLSDEQVAVLKCLANQVTKLLELRKTNYLLVESQKNWKRMLHKWRLLLTSPPTT